ncbi:MAG: hypothetical protein KatS3mg027_2264 [Bacteroidia bacterium]|nr:MAG: hypothetical protein KatS3mg027_2264 [Bacteroidia bacterium]
MVDGRCDKKYNMSYSIENFNIALKLRIDWSELDYFGHVNNVSFFKYIQAGRVNYWEKIGLIEYYKQHKIGPHVVFL